MVVMKKCVLQSVNIYSVLFLDMNTLVFIYKQLSVTLYDSSAEYNQPAIFCKLPCHPQIQWSCRNFFPNNILTPRFLNIYIHKIIQLCKLIPNHCFSFSIKKNYKQKLGLPMGSLISNALACIFSKIFKVQHI